MALDYSGPNLHRVEIVQGIKPMVLVQVALDMMFQPQVDMAQGHAALGRGLLWPTTGLTRGWIQGNGSGFKE